MLLLNCVVLLVTVLTFPTAALSCWCFVVILCYCFSVVLKYGCTVMLPSCRFVVQTFFWHFVLLLFWGLSSWQWLVLIVCNAVVLSCCCYVAQTLSHCRMVMLLLYHIVALSCCFLVPLSFFSSSCFITLLLFIAVLAGCCRSYIHIRCKMSHRLSLCFLSRGPFSSYDAYVYVCMLRPYQHLEAQSGARGPFSANNLEKLFSVTLL